MMTDRHLHWRFYAYNESQRTLLPDGHDRITGMVTVEVAGHQNEESATEAARELITRDTFILNYVWECNTCKYQDTMADFMTGGKG